MNHPYRKSTIVGFLLALSVAVPVFAQNQASTVASTTNNTLAASVMAVCKAENKVSVQFFKKSQTAFPGADFYVTGRIINPNTFPIGDADIVVRIVKAAEMSGSAYDTATDTIDRYVAVKDLSIDASSTALFSFKWSVPTNLPNGRYYINVFIISSGRFPIVGRESENIVTASYPVSIVSSAIKEVSYFDLNSISVNGSKVSAGTVLVPDSSKITISAGILDTHLKTHQEIVFWRVYPSDVISDKNIIESSTETVNIDPEKESKVTLSIPQIDKPVYYVIGGIKDGGKSSLFSLRIVRVDSSQALFTLLGVQPFPLDPQKPALVFGCLSKSAPFNDRAKAVEISLVGSDGSLIYGGKTEIKSIAMSGFFDGFVAPKSGRQSFQIVANVVDGSGSVISSSVIPYSCDKNKCPEETPIKNYHMVYYIIGIVLLVLIILVALFIDNKKRKSLVG